MGSYFQRNPPSAERVAEWRKDIAAARPYTDDDPEPFYFDYTENPARSDATDAMELLKAAGLWTEEDERIAFGPHEPQENPGGAHDLPVQPQE